MPTVESSIGRTPISDNSVVENTKIFSTYEPSSQLKYSANKYAIAENIQNALRHQSAYAQVFFLLWNEEDNEDKTKQQYTINMWIDAFPTRKFDKFRIYAIDDNNMD